MGQDKAVQTLFVTLRRSLIGKPHFHLKVLTSLGLNKRLLCVEKPNNPAIRGMLRKVAHLVTIETDHMYYNRKLAEYQASKLRPPVTVRHNLTGSLAAAPLLHSSSSSRPATSSNVTTSVNTSSRTSSSPTSKTSSRTSSDSTSRQHSQQHL